MSVIIKLLLVTISFLLIFGCSKKEETKATHITLVCKGETETTFDSSISGKSSQPVYKVEKVIEVVNDLYGRNHDESSWRITYPGQGIGYSTQMGDDSNQSGHPWWKSIVSVNDKEITYNGSGGNDFDSSKGDIEMNQKHEHTQKVTIDRLTGKWLEDGEYKTYWKNGSYTFTRTVKIGKCEKGEQKF